MSSPEHSKASGSPRDNPDGDCAAVDAGCAGWGEGWPQTSVSTVDEVRPVLEGVAGDMAALGYPPRDIFGMRLALEEAVVNAIKHGHRNDPAKQVRVQYRGSRGSVRVVVEDQGPGFDPSQVPDAAAPENLERACGRGLLLMCAFMTWVRYNDRGNSVMLCKYRSGPPPQC